MKCEHDLIVVYRGHSDTLSEEVVRWCKECGAVVVDLDYDGRTNAGQILKMKLPKREKNNVQCG
jgi:hypothetical protein